MTLLTDADLFEITGKKLPAGQCEVLDQNRIPYTRRADGRPRLTWEVYNGALLGKSGRVAHNPSPPTETSGFNLAAAS